MNSLIVYGKPGFSFNEEELFQQWQNLPGVSHLEQGRFVGASLQCEYECESDRTIARLSDELRTVTIAGTGDASLQFALALQQREAQPLFVTDFGYDFNIALQGLRSIDEIKRDMVASLDFAENVYEVA